MKKNFLLITFLFCVLNSSLAQNKRVKQWDYRFGGTNIDFLTVLKETGDGGYILGGTSLSDSSGDKTQHNWDGTQISADYWVVKTDSQGIKQWDKRYGGTKYDVLNSIGQTSDGGYIFGGASRSGITGDKTELNRDAGLSTSDFWIVKTDSAGVKQWDKRFGGTKFDELFSVQQTSDGGYALAGSSWSDNNGDRSQSNWDASLATADYWIVKTDSAGAWQWDKRFGGTGDDQLSAMQQTADGGYILGGFSRSDSSGDKTQHNWSAGIPDYWIVKINSSGIKQWDKRFGGTDEDWFVSLQQTTDDGYILGGYSKSDRGGDKSDSLLDTVANVRGHSDFWIVKIDPFGTKQWDKKYGGRDSEDDFGSVTQTTDGGYLIAGTSYSDSSDDKSQNNLIGEQTWIVKTDSMGIKQWDKTLLTNGLSHDEIGYAIQGKDGCYVFANFTNAGAGADKTQASWGNYDYWMIKYCDSPSVTILPPVSKFLASDTLICTNTCLNFTNLSNYASSYKWYFAGAKDSVSTSPNPQHICYLTAGTYNVTLVASNVSGRDSITLIGYIIVKPTPKPPVIQQSGIVLYFHPDSTYASYQWYDSTMLINNATDTAIVITHAGQYNVEVVNKSGCKIAGGITVTITDIQKLTVDGLQFTVSPNPAKDNIWLNCAAIDKNATVRIYNVFGQMLYQSVILNPQFEINVADFPSGIYFVEMKSESGNVVKRFVKK